MGQKSNVISLRKNVEKVFLINTRTSDLFSKSLVFLKFFEKFCLVKNILISSKTISLVNNTISFYFEIFFRSNKLMFYKKKSKIKITLLKKKIFFKRNVTFFLCDFFNKKKHNLVDLNFNILNLNLINKNFLRSLKEFYAFNKRFLFVLFDRRLNLFIDFLKIMVLFAFNKVSLNVFLFIICQIFRNLSKTKHTKFLLFIRELFFFLINFNLNDKNNNYSIVGLKLVINGKIKGKTRATSTCIKKGSVPIQSLNKKIEYSKSHVFTRYGAFGFQLWVHIK